MIKRWTALLLLLSLLTGCSAGTAAKAAETSPAEVNSHTEAPLSTTDPASQPKEDAAKTELPTVEETPVLEAADLSSADLSAYENGEVLVGYADGTFAVLTFDGEDALAQGLAQLAEDETVTLFQPNYAYEGSALTSDPLSDQQWALYNDGSFQMVEEENQHPVYEEPFETPFAPGHWSAPWRSPRAGGVTGGSPPEIQYDTFSHRGMTYLILRVTDPDGDLVTTAYAAGRLTAQQFLGGALGTAFLVDDTGSVTFRVPNGGTYTFYASDSAGNEMALTVTLPANHHQSASPGRSF